VRTWVAVAFAGVGVAALPGSAAAAASAWSDHEVVASRLVAGAPAADGSPRLGLHFRLAPEWHVYWKHPGDAGAPPEVSIAAGAGGADGNAVETEVLYPAPQRFRLPGGLEAWGYQGEVVYPLRLSAAAPARGRIAASVDYVACAVECIPFHDELTLSLPETADASGAEEELLRQWEARLPQAPEAVGVTWRLRYRAGEAPEIELELRASNATSTGGDRQNAGIADAGRAPELFLEPAPGATFASPERIAYTKAVRFRAAVRPEVAGQPPQSLRVAWTVTSVPASDGVVAVAGVTTVPAGGQAGSGGSGSDSPAAAAPAHRGGEARAAPTAAILALLGLAALAAALVLWLLPERLRLPAPALALRVAGFLAAAALVWIAYRLGALLPAARVAGVELSWLVVALGVQGATQTPSHIRRRLWLAFALLAAASGVWAAWPAMLSP